MAPHQTLNYRFGLEVTLSDLDDLFFKNAVRKVKAIFSLDTFLPHVVMISQHSISIFDIALLILETCNVVVRMDF